MIRRPPRSTRKESSAASDVYKRQRLGCVIAHLESLAAFSQPQASLLCAVLCPHTCAGLMPRYRVLSRVGCNGVRALRASRVRCARHVTRAQVCNRLIRSLHTFRPRLLLCAFVCSCVCNGGRALALLVLRRIQRVTWLGCVIASDELLHVSFSPPSIVTVRCCLRFQHATYVAKTCETNTSSF